MQDFLPHLTFHGRTLRFRPASFAQLAGLRRLGALRLKPWRRRPSFARSRRSTGRTPAGHSRLVLDRGWRRHVPSPSLMSDFQRLPEVPDVGGIRLITCRRKLTRSLAQGSLRQVVEETQVRYARSNRRVDLSIRKRDIWLLILHH